MESQEKIISAFKDIQHPGNLNLLREDSEDDSDVSFLYSYEGMKWSEIDPRILVVEGACLSALSDQGLLYVIPAYLLEFSRSDYQDPNGWVDRLLDVLATRGRGRLKLTRRQMAVVNDVFLNDLERSWKLHGKLGTCYGDNIGLLIDKVRREFSCG